MFAPARIRSPDRPNRSVITKYNRFKILYNAPPHHTRNLNPDRLFNFERVCVCVVCVWCVCVWYVWYVCGVVCVGVWYVCGVCVWYVCGVVCVCVVCVWCGVCGMCVVCVYNQHLYRFYV
jgi:hypothetical protein